jgi:peptidoglycan/xylan/chitin deacetylase (PgdA/CDA1 family)
VSDAARQHWREMALGRYLRVVNFHSTPADRATVYEEQLAAYARDFSPVTLEDLDRLFETGSWHADRPGLVPVFYEGYRAHHDVVAPILERLGLTGWFFVPTAFLSVPVGEQVAYARQHRLGIVDGEYADGRHALTGPELAALGRRHEICAHTANHAPVDSIATPADVEREIIEPARVLEQLLGRRPEVFAWLGGTAMGLNPLADEALRAAGFRYLFSNTKIQRLQARDVLPAAS